MKAFYHKSDLDGHCSGAIVKRKYQQCEMIGVDYEDTLESLGMVGAFQTMETVFVVDFSFDISDMEYLKSHTDLNWIDHHKSAIEKLDGLECNGIQETGKAACELTWEFLFDEEMPLSVLFLGRYDVWDHKDKRVLPFQYGMRAFSNTRPDSEIWNDILDYTVETQLLIESGSAILSYEENQNKKYAASMSFETIFKGLRAIVVNKPFSNSKVFDSVWDESKYDIMIIFGYKPNKFKYSLYSTKENVDCSEIAVSFGGGGHKGAAGFISDKLLF